VRQTVITTRHDQSGQKQLVGYVVGEEGLGAEELPTYLSKKLPEQMVPGIYVLLKEFPLTANGKVDRRALPEPELEASERESSAPGNPIEEILAEIFSQALNLDRLGIEDNFFELGGHSLLATQVISRVKVAFMVELPLRALFEAPTVAALARRVE